MKDLEPLANWLISNNSLSGMVSCAIYVRLSYTDSRPRFPCWLGSSSRGPKEGRKGPQQGKEQINCMATCDNIHPIPEKLDGPPWKVIDRSPKVNVGRGSKTRKKNEIEEVKSAEPTATMLPRGRRLRQWPAIWTRACTWTLHCSRPRLHPRI